MTRAGAGRLALRALALTAALVACACGESKADAHASGRRTTLHVYAASSLTDVFPELARGFEQAYPEVEVRLTFAGSQVLRLQVAQGAPAALIASANAAHVQALAAAGHTTRPTVFAHTDLALVVPKANPAGLTRFADLPKARRLVIGTPQTPIGRYTSLLFERARSELGAPFADAVAQRVVSTESNVRLVRAKVALGEADAAVVYSTDARLQPNLRTIPIPPALNVRARYVIAATRGPRAHPRAADFVAYLSSAAGAATLRRGGFGEAAP